MNLSLNWLSDYVDLPKNLDSKQLSHDLTMSTVEVENVIDLKKSFDNMVIGFVQKLYKHSNADKLKLAVTDIGTGSPVQIVCGGVNLKEGMTVPVALPGSKVRWHGEGDLVELEETKIRGEKSFGMICASNEIGIDGQYPCGEMEITDLGSLNTKPGTPLAKALDLDDVILEIDNKSLTHRPDLWSHFGIARELAAIYKTKLKDPKLANVKAPKSNELKVNIKNTDHCSRYIGVIVSGIKIDKSPDWLAKRLSAIGQRPINNIVDITNYVMNDMGQPTHAFDAAKLDEGNMSINVRTAKKGENIQTLDGENRKLESDTLVIADASKPVALAGVMGGFSSEVTQYTTKLVLESATFDATSIRKTSTKLAHRTDSSARYEKALDPELAKTAMLRMIKLIQDIIPEAKIEAWIDEYPGKAKNISIKVGHSFLEKRIGQSFNKKEIVGILEKLGFVVSESKGTYTVKVPSWRATGDISIPEDIVEEVARIYGYDNLKPHDETVELTKAIYQPKHQLELDLKKYLSVGCSMSEVFNYPWTEKKIDSKYGLEPSAIEIQNPPSEENSGAASSLISNLVKNVEDNIRFFSDFKIFELSRVFHSNKDKWDKSNKDTLPHQPKMVAGAVVYSGKKDTYLEVKGIIEGLVKEIGSPEYTFKNNGINLKYLDENKRTLFLINNQVVGWFGQMKDKIKGKSISLFEINFDELVETYKGKENKFEHLPQFPSIERDIAIETDWSNKWASIKEAVIKEIPQNIFGNIAFLSEYDLGTKKSLAFRITYQADRTLKDEEVETAQSKIVKKLESKFNSKLRQ